MNWKNIKTRFNKISGLNKCLILAVIIVGIEFWFLGDAVFCALESKNSDDIRNYFLIFVASAGAPFLIWRAIIASRNTEIANHVANTNRKNQITQAYSTAIEQLGSTHLKGDTHIENIETRLGAIYTLEKIALSNEDYHQSIIEILASYVRQNSPNKKNENKETSNENKETSNENKEISIIIQTILTVIVRRRSKFDNQAIDLCGCNLTYTLLRDADLEHIALMYSDLSGSVLIRPDLRDVDLSTTDLTGAYLSNIKIDDKTKFPEGYEDKVKNVSFQKYDESTGEWTNATE